LIFCRFFKGPIPFFHPIVPISYLHYIYNIFMKT